MDDDVQAIESPSPSPVIVAHRGVDPDTQATTVGVGVVPSGFPVGVGAGSSVIRTGNFQPQIQTPTVQQQSQVTPPIPPPPQSKYAQLLAVIEEMGKDIRPTYAGSKSSAERLKRGIVHARILVRECLMETERSARQ
ncbi:cyclin-dependent kinase 2-associated protein 2-like [Hetaerina americana]|uniref:cyclin-dependent kinase 2-associated protein 2-like n=1 Tax=Hetaerina americana TaxID=62018 RepID=UPI003A7F4727